MFALPSDVARGGKGVKTAFRQVLDKMIEVFASNLAEPETRERAFALVALCTGAIESLAQKHHYLSTRALKFRSFRPNSS